MTENATKIRPAHRRRDAYVYVRQSTLTQVREHTESLQRQYELADRAMALGWPASQVVVIDDDLGRSGADATTREGFKLLVADVGLGKVGIILGIKVSRLASNNADWYQLLDLCALTDTLIADGDGCYHPADFNDRLVLGLKGTMSEAELHLIRHRLTAGLRHKAAKGELRQRLPVGFVHDDDDPHRPGPRRGGSGDDRHGAAPLRRARLRPPGHAQHAGAGTAGPAAGGGLQEGHLGASQLPGDP